MDYDPVRRGFAEFVGTFTLVFIGAGSILTFGKLFAGAFAAGSGSQVAGLGLVAVALAHGLAIGVMVSAVGHISGGHFNPAITLGFLVTRRLAPILALVYWVVQLTAAVAAAALLHWFFTMSERNAVQLGAPLLGSGITQWQAADPGGTFKSIAGLAIGLTITLDILMGGPLTGAAMNPARAFGPELIQNDWTNAWIYYAGPAIGGVVAAASYEWLYLRPTRPIPVGPPETGVIEPRPGDTAVS